jgi:uncharacterized membrane protein (UPF0127 family)
MRLSYLVPLFVLSAALFACGDDGPKPQATGPTRTLTVSSGAQQAKLTVELATTSGQRQQGLMLRQSLPEQQGMLFLFPKQETIGFWMKNTYIPLTIAYLAEDGTVLELREAKPLDETILTPKQPYRWVLEVNQGWFDRNGLGPGARVTLPNDLPQAE